MHYIGRDGITEEVHSLNGNGTMERTRIPFEGIDFSDCRGQCGTLPCCTACMKEKERLAEEAELRERAEKEAARGLRGPSSGNGGQGIS
ncbi:MAG TPA: hypothetical protein PLE04_07540 [Syntrophales bacterium]|nr:hypothetical protein [Syntrophales bacterium]